MVPTTSKVLVLTTGGTSDKACFDALSTYKVGDSQVEHLLRIARVTHPFRIDEFMRKDNLELDHAGRALIKERVTSAAELKIVISHGTNTMTKTAAALESIPGKTIVLVGALAPARFSQSDAAFNLGMAFAAVQVAPMGTYIAKNGTVFPAGRVVQDQSRGTGFQLDQPHG